LLFAAQAAGPAGKWWRSPGGTTEGSHSAASADADVGLEAVVDTDLTEVGLCPGNKSIVESERQVYRV
jgi:hypothetical protein